MTNRRPNRPSRIRGNFRREAMAMVSVTAAVGLVETDFAGILADKVFCAVAKCSAARA